MKKRLLALWLIAALTLSALPALAASPVNYTMDTKLTQQLEGSGFYGTVTFDAAGDSVALLDGATFDVLKRLLPGLKADVTYTAQRQGGAEGNVTLSLNDTALSSAKWYNDATLTYFTSDLISAGEYCAFARDWDYGQMLSSLIPGSDNPWPSLLGPLMAVNTASADWQTRAAAALEPYTTKIGLWMSAYVTSHIGNENGAAYSQLDYAIPAQAVKSEIKQLLVDLYGDQTMLSLLRERFSAKEAAAYLQSGMMPAFFAMLDAVDLSGQVLVTRRFDSAAKPLLTQIDLPFPASFPLESLSILVTPGEAGDTTSLTALLRPGEGQTEATRVSVTCQAAEEMAYTGRVEITAPKAEAFAVGASSGYDTQAFTFSLTHQSGQTTYTLAQDLVEQKMGFTLMVRPEAQDSVYHAQSLTVEATLSSRSDKSAPTYVNAQVSYTDQTTGGSLSMSFTGNTAMAWAPNMPAALSEAKRLDLMDDAQREAKVGEMTAYLTNRLTAILASVAAAGTQAQ